MATPGDQAEPVNPYAPSAVTDPREAFAEAGVGVWRQGDLLVMHCDAKLPPICLKTGQPATDWFTQNLTWHPHLFRPKSLELKVPLCRRRYFVAARVRWMLIGLAVAMIPVGFGLTSIHNARGAFVVGSLLAAVSAVLIGVFLAEPVRIRRSHGDYLWLDGAGEAFLAQLPVWQHGM